jgi:Photosynthesis system II assembly factor YCF48
MRFFILLTALLTLLSCIREESPVYYKAHHSITSDILHAIDIDHNGYITIVGGYVWSRGISLQSDGDLSTLTLDSFSNKGQFDLLRTKNHDLISVGNEGQLFQKTSHREPWKFHRLQNWDILHHVIETEHGYLAAGGKSYEHGYIYLINREFGIDTALYFGHEISEVAHITGQNYLSVGWGNIQRSSDGGKNWELLPNEGDFYASCVFTDQLNGWIVGYNGSLLKSTDSGHTWQKSNAKISGNGYNSFRKLVQIDVNELIITGNNGKIWRSVDAGKNWIRTALPDENDIYDISKKSDGNYIMVGSDGYIAEIGF